MARSAGKEDQTRKFYLHVPFQERYLFKKHWQNEFADQYHEDMRICAS